MGNYRIYRQPLAAIGIVVGLLFWSPSHARDADNLPNVMILATGGTIADTGTTSTTTIGYTAATVGVQALIEAVPDLKKVANSRASRCSRSPART
jgi:L-asparaginase